MLLLLLQFLDSSKVNDADAGADVCVVCDCDVDSKVDASAYKSKIHGVYIKFVVTQNVELFHVLLINFLHFTLRGEVWKVGRENQLDRLARQCEVSGGAGEE